MRAEPEASLQRIHFTSKITLPDIGESAEECEECLRGVTPFQQGLPHLFDNRVPLTQHALSEQTHRRIPGVVGSICQPSPVCTSGQKHPDWSSGGTRQMSNRGVNTNDQIKRLHDSQRI
jgi:hypothetical protein